MTTAICPGSFDPITLGHVSVIERAAKIFDNVVVCLMYNSNKPSPMFTIEEKLYMTKLAVENIPNVTVDVYSGLLAEYVRRYEKPVVVKGLRAASDFDYEFQMNLINKRLNPNVDTMFIPSSEHFTFLSSSIVRELAQYGSSLDGLVPNVLIPIIEEKAKQWR